MYDKKVNKDIVFGLHPVMELIKSGKEINKILIQKGLQGNLFHELRAMLRHSMVNIQLVPVQKLNNITRKNHQGVIAFISPVTYHKVEDLIPRLYEEGKEPKFIVLDGITDVRNFGAIARTAECMGFNGVVIPAKGGATVTSDAIKTSAGALMNIPVCRVDSLKKSVDFMTESGLKLVACTEKTEDSIYDFDYSGPIGIIMGNEETGISNDLINRSQYVGKIPMTGGISSMNVAVAAGIVMYESVRNGK
ncbi:MAG: 23S rRNA (guanosine(2251)-2'-O)-methyltransferase RlmB [Flavobacteriales bacterium]